MAKLRQADEALAKGTPIAEVARSLGVSEVTLHRWRAEYGAVHDDYISIGDAESSRVIYVTDHPGGRLELRRYERVTRTETPLADRELFAEALNRRVWGKLFVDSDGDLVITHMICCLGGVYQPNFMQSVRAFLGLCRFIRDECDPAELLWLSEERPSHEPEGGSPGPWRRDSAAPSGEESGDSAQRDDGGLPDAGEDRQRMNTETERQKAEDLRADHPPGDEAPPTEEGSPPEDGQRS